ncbi:lyase family protein [uncultured Friedmanniella sp.]|uniref:lyase family protein n=1 Tax=uncultured Friedmanniella sp. TaxID=335381 RepID=UPI0035CB0386
MADLYWPGDERAGVLMSDLALLEAMSTVEEAWLEALVDAGLAPAEARVTVRGLVGESDSEFIARGAEAGGNPVIGLVALLRTRLPEEASRWLHRGLTSQDVLDTALVLTLRDVLDEVERQLRRQAAVLVALAEAHGETVMIGRTLTQHAVPLTFGLKAATWLGGVLDAGAAVTTAHAALAVQAGGAAGTLAAAAELARLSGHPDPAAVAVGLVAGTAGRLVLQPRLPWHTNRGIVTAVGDALVTATDAWGHLAADVTTLSRPEVGELAEGPSSSGAARGGSSTMPGKANPVLSVLVRRAALAAPGLAATLHLAAATTVDERPDGAWHVEWATLRDLGRRTVVAASQTTELLGDLHVHAGRMRATLEAAGPSTEQQSMAALVGGVPSGPYLGAAAVMVDAVLARARTFLEADA